MSEYICFACSEEKKPELEKLIVAREVGSKEAGDDVDDDAEDDDEEEEDE